VRINFIPELIAEPSFEKQLEVELPEVVVAVPPSGKM
jgi:hypothetical protein